MPQNIALQGNVPQFNVGPMLEFGANMAQKNEVLKNTKMQSQMNAMKLQEAQGQFQAMQEYRKRTAAGDEDAIDALDAYPEIQKQEITGQLIEGMDPKEFAAARKRANAFGKAAQYVSQFPEGPGQKQAWNDMIDKLAGEKLMDSLEAKHWKAAGPSALILDQVLTTAEYIEKYAATKKGAKGGQTPEQRQLTEARTEEVNARTEGVRTKTKLLEIGGGSKAGAKDKAADPLSQRIKADRAINDKFRTLGLDKPDSWLGNEEGKARAEAEFEKYKADLERYNPAEAPPVDDRSGLNTSASNPSNVAAKTSRGGPGGAVTVSTIEELKKLPAGTLYVNPADGKIYKKK